MGLTTIKKITELAELGYSIKIHCAPYARHTYFANVYNGVSSNFTQYSNKDIDELIDQVYSNHRVETWTAQQLMHPEAPPYDPAKDI